MGNIFYVARIGRGCRVKAMNRIDGVRGMGEHALICRKANASKRARTEEASAGPPETKADSWNSEVTEPAPELIAFPTSASTKSEAAKAAASSSIVPKLTAAIDQESKAQA